MCGEVSFYWDESFAPRTLWLHQEDMNRIMRGVRLVVLIISIWNQHQRTLLICGSAPSTSSRTVLHPLGVNLQFHVIINLSGCQGCYQYIHHPGRWSLSKTPEREGRGVRPWTSLEFVTGPMQTHWHPPYRETVKFSQEHKDSGYSYWGKNIDFWVQKMAKMEKHWSIVQ